jgi:hypothetical protein
VVSVLSQKVIKDQRSVTREIAGETIIVPVRSGVGDLDSIYTLNEVGTAVWRLVDGRRTVGEIVTAIADQFDVTREQAERDTLEFIEALRSEGLVRPVKESET